MLVNTTSAVNNSPLVALWARLKALECFCGQSKGLVSLLTGGLIGVQEQCNSLEGCLCLRIAS